MKVRSIKIDGVDELIKNIPVGELRSKTGVNYPPVELRIDLKNKTIVYIYYDYSDVEKQVQSIITQYIQLKTKLTDPLKQPTLFAKVMNLANKFNELTGYDIEDVI